MSTRAIRTSTEQTICDVCGRTLLRGERAEVYIGGGDRHSVCPLCTARALHGGWVREGTMPDYGPAGSRDDRRRGLFGRRRRRETESTELEENPFGDEFFVDPDPAPLQAAPDPDAPLAEPADHDPVEPVADATPAAAPEWPEPSARAERSRGGRRRRGGASPAGSERPAAPRRESASRSGREPRHIRAVPTSMENKIASAVALFNESEHPRTVAGIARSLGLPDVAVHPTSPVGGIVHVVVSWELCWYRYEVDLSEEVPTVRGAGQGYEPGELSEPERTANAVADDSGAIAVATGNLPGR